MSVSGVEPAVVYLSPQAISPLSASKEPIAMALAVRPEPRELVGSILAKDADTLVKAVGAADKAGLNNTQEKQRTSVLSNPPAAGVAMAGKVDIYV